MKKRVFIIHGWDGTPNENWLPWLKKELLAKNFEVVVPQLPETNQPKVEKWLPALTKLVGVADANTYFVGHSLAAALIVKYLEQLPPGVKIGSAVFVAGFLTSVTNPRNNPELNKIRKNWIAPGFNLKKSRQHLLKSVAIFSNNDQFVPLENATDFKNNLGSKIIIQNSMGHFGQKECPEVLEVLLQITG